MVILLGVVVVLVRRIEVMPLALRSECGAPDRTSVRLIHVERQGRA